MNYKRNKRIDYCLGMIKENICRDENKIDFTLHIWNSLHILKNNTKDPIFKLEEPLLGFKEEL